MTALILTIRPEPGCTATVEAGRELGLAIEGCPLFAIRSLPWDPPAPESIDALLLGSANAVRHAGPALDLFRGKPVYSVGAATGKAAEDAGFPVAVCGQGVLQPVVDSLAGQQLRLLRVTGAEHVPISPPSGVSVETRVAYESAGLPLPDELALRLNEGALVLLHSAVAARHFASECDRCAVSRSRIALAALGPRIADAAGDGWAKVRCASVPAEAALLALASDMCHDRP
ncbi:MAG: uroporphyrinogen-III synthase [Porphyrobacter sp.]|nr:uroporphyrinogen-III synthase [Porphyrobacter sp.]